MTVSVCMITYNHETFIHEAIEGVLMQKTNFPIEVVIGEDCSTDSTLVICEEYASLYPKIIRLLSSKKNLGLMPNFIRTLRACTGKYIALCEGDDYWTDPYKLQKQVDFLESNYQYSLCFSNALVLYADQDIQSYPLYDPNSKIIDKSAKESLKQPPEISTIADLAQGNYIPTASVVVRNIITQYGLPQYINHVPIGDWPFFLFCASKGKIKYIPEVLVAYRVHSGGVWSNISQLERWAGILQIYPHLFESEVFESDVKKIISNKLPQKLNRLRQRCKEANREDLYQKTLTVFLSYSPDIIFSYIEFLQEMIDGINLSLKNSRLLKLKHILRSFLNIES